MKWYNPGSENIDYPYDKAEYYQEGLFKVTVKKKSYIFELEK